MNWTLALAIITACLIGILVGATITIAIQQQALVIARIIVLQHFWYA